MLKKIINKIKATGIFSLSLKDARETASTSMGCYKIYCDGLKYVGRAENGLRKEFDRLYNGKHKIEALKKINENKDKVSVSFVILPTKEKCREIEMKWLNSLKPEWNNMEK